MRRFQLLHEKIHLGSQHIDTVDLVHAPRTSWLLFTPPTLVGSYLVNQCLCSRNIERKERTTRCCVNVVLGLLIQAVKEVLNDQPLFYAVVWACLNVLLEALPSF